MKNIIKTSIISSLLMCIAITSCTQEMMDSILETNTLEYDSNGNYVFNASLNDTESTKTIRQNNGAIYWDKDESIKIFYNSQTYGVFTSTNTAASSTSSFSGKFNSPISDNDILQNGIIALYPSQEAEYNDGNVIFTLPSQQEAEVGTFKKGLFPTIAQSKSSSLSFYNICGGIKLSVYYEGINTITIRGNNSEYLAGKISASFSSSGIPEYTVVDGVSEITLTAPQGGYFEVGKMYYIVALPGTLLNGFTITYHTDDEEGTTKINETVTIHRSKFGLVLDKDKHGFVVSFADPAFKTSVVDLYDDNFDGEIDYLEAENVTNINCSNSGVTSLDGIEYFTNLKSLNCSNNSIKEIDLSSKSKLTTLYCYGNPIETLNLDGCVALGNMSIVNATTSSIANKKVNIDGYQGSDKLVFSANDTAFTDFSFVNSNTIKSLEVSGSFTTSLNIYNVPGVSELKVSHMNVKVLDLHNLGLESIDLTKNTNLEELYLQNNNLTSINLTKNTKLYKLNISDNNLQSLNLRQNSSLMELRVNNNNSLSILNFGDHTYIQVIEAEGTSISTIDLSQFKYLGDVKLRNNPQLRSMVIWKNATKRNDSLLFDMANVMVTDADGNSYGYPYTVGQYIPWFKGGVVYHVNDDGGGLIVHCDDISSLQNGYGTYSSKWYRSLLSSDPYIPEMFYGNSETDGEYNHKVVYDYYNGYDKFDAYNTCARISKDGKWYVPAINELVDLVIKGRGAVNTTLFKNEGDKVMGKYWSSTIDSNGKVYIVTNATASGMDYLPEHRVETMYKYGSTWENEAGVGRAIRKF